jgi:transcription elongation factor SPT5
MRRDSLRAIATDSEGHELRVGDNVKEIDGEVRSYFIFPRFISHLSFQGRKGQVLHIHQSHFAFLHNREIVENGGVFVTRARSLASLAPKGNAMKPGVGDLSKMNPAMSGGAPLGGMVGSGNMGRGPRDRLIGVFVTVIKGPNKGLHGTIKDTNGPLARVELSANNKVISIEKEKLKRLK